MSSIIQGLTILQKYFNKDGWNICAEHDEISVAATDNPVSDEDYKVLKELGWFQDGHDEGCSYDQQDYWKVYT